VGIARLAAARTSTPASDNRMQSSPAVDLLLNAIMVDLHGKFGTKVRTVYSTYHSEVFQQEVTVVFTNNRTAKTIYKGRDLDPEFLALCALLYDLPESDGG